MTPLTSITQIDTPTLRLRPVQADDLPALLAINGDPEVTRFLPYRHWTGLTDARAWFDRMQALRDDAGAAQLVLQRQGDGELLGTLLLFRPELGSARAEIGYVLGRAHWGRGWMRQAVAAACGHAFTHLGVRRIEAEVNPANVASCRLLQRVGFTLEGTLRQRWCGADGVPYDVHAFGLLASDGFELA
jgi:ribosomal-protein-alanine N-acetyltransferase